MCTVYTSALASFKSFVESFLYPDPGELLCTYYYFFVVILFMIFKLIIKSLFHLSLWLCHAC